MALGSCRCVSSSTAVLPLTWPQTALAEARAGIIQVPALGTASIGGPCPTIRDFRIVDQDQSDNSLTAYALLNGGTVVAQATPANSKNATLILNGSDNRLVDAFIDPALGCTPWMLPSLTAPTGMTSGVATNEILAAFHQAAPIAEVPSTDPMVLDNGQPNLQKTNLYREAVGQTPLQALDPAMPLQYCNNITIGGIFASQNQALLANNPSPMPDVANSLFTFLAQRFAASINDCNLNCLALWGLAVNPVTLTLDGNGVVTAATINVPVLQMLGMGLTVTNTTATSSTMSSVSSVAQSSTTSQVSSATSLAASSTSSFAAFRNTTKTAVSVSATVAASSPGAIVSLSSNANKGATFTPPTTLATMTVAATTPTSVAAGSGSAVGGGTGATGTALAVVPTSTCTCPVTAPTAPAAAAPMFVQLANGLVQNTQTKQLFVPLPAFLDNLFQGNFGR